MVVEPEPVVVAERVAEVALDRAPVRDRRVRPAGGVVGVLHHDHLPGELAPRGPARQQARAGEVLGRAAGRAAGRRRGTARTRARRRRPGSGGSRCTRGTRGCRRPLRRPVARPRSARRSRRRRGACRRPRRCRTACARPRRRCRSASPRPPSPPVDIPSSTTPAGVSPAPPPENIRSMRPRGSPVAARSAAVTTRVTVVFSSMRLVASSPSAPMYPGTFQKSSM